MKRHSPRRLLRFRGNHVSIGSSALSGFMSNLQQLQQEWPSVKRRLQGNIDRGVRNDSARQPPKAHHEACDSGLCDELKQQHLVLFLCWQIARCSSLGRGELSLGLLNHAHLNLPRKTKRML